MDSVTIAAFMALIMMFLSIPLGLVHSNLQAQLVGILTAITFRLLL